MVTGASSGLGRACCERLSRNPGYHVYGLSRTAGAPGGWTYVAMDITDETSVNRALSHILNQEARIDAIVHCAGDGLAGSVEDCTIGEAQAQFDTNYFGTIRLVRATLPALRRQRGGKIVIIGSIGGLIGLPFMAHYSASKFALDGLVEALRAEIAPFGIEATILHPGDYCTPFGTHRRLGAATGGESAYFERCKQAVAFYDAAEQNGGAPDAVARKVENLIGRRRLPVRAIVGAPLERGGVLAKRVLPGRWFEALFRAAHSP